MKPGPKGKFLRESFFEKVKKGINEDDCWLWISTIGNNKRGIMRINQQNIVAQRASWLIHFGEIPKGESVLNTCKNNLCVNPNHLYLGGHKDRKYEHNEKSLEERFWEKVAVKTKEECWEWLAYKTQEGYGRIKYKDRSLEASRASWMINRGEIPKRMFVLHICDNPACVNPDHLYIGDHLDNMRDKKEKNRCNSPKGSKHFNSKLTEKDVTYIKSIPIGFGDITRLAQKYGVTKHTISAILHNKNWKHIKGGTL